MLFLALRHLISRKKQTMLTLLGIILGTAAFVLISSMMLGFREYFIDQLINNDAHIHITAKEDFLKEHDIDQNFFPKISHVFWKVPPSGLKGNARINNPQGWYKRLDADGRVEAYSPQLSTQVIISRSGVSVTAQFIGVNAKQQERVTNIKKYMVSGQFSDISSGGNRIVLGQDLLNKLGARVSEMVLVSNGKSVPVPFKIVGLFEVGISLLDSGTIFGSLPDAQRMNQTPNQINNIALKLKDVEWAHPVADSWTSISEEKVQTWDQLNTGLLNVFDIQNAIRYIMTASILIVAGFSIYNILSMVVSQKRKEVAILRSMGFEAADIINLFLIQGIVLGVLGATIGLALGFVTSKYLSTLPFGGGPMGKGTGKLLMSTDPSIYISGFLSSFASAALASILPARSAGKLTPIDIIRSES